MNIRHKSNKQTRRKVTKIYKNIYIISFILFQIHILNIQLINLSVNRNS